MWGSPMCKQPICWVDFSVIFSYHDPPWSTKYKFGAANYPPLRFLVSNEIERHGQADHSCLQDFFQVYRAFDPLPKQHKRKTFKTLNLQFIVSILGLPMKSQIHVFKVFPHYGENPSSSYPLPSQPSSSLRFVKYHRLRWSNCWVIWNPARPEIPMGNWWIRIRGGLGLVKFFPIPKANILSDFFWLTVEKQKFRMRFMIRRNPACEWLDDEIEGVTSQVFLGLMVQKWWGKPNGSSPSGPPGGKTSGFLGGRRPRGDFQLSQLIYLQGCYLFIFVF